MKNKYLSVPHYLIDGESKYLLQFYVAIQYVAKKMGNRKSVICPDTFKYTFGFSSERIKDQYKKLDEEFPFIEKSKGRNLIVNSDAFNVKWEDHFEMLNDDEFDMLINNAALLQHYLFMLKLANGRKTLWCGLNKFSSLEGVNEKTIRRLNDKLKEFGLISVKRRMNGCNEYIIKYNEEDNPFD